MICDCYRNQENINNNIIKQQALFWKKFLKYFPAVGRHQSLFIRKIWAMTGRQRSYQTRNYPATSRTFNIVFIWNLKHSPVKFVALDSSKLILLSCHLLFARFPYNVNNSTVVLIIANCLQKFNLDQLSNLLHLPHKANLWWCITGRDSDFKSTFCLLQLSFISIILLIMTKSHGKVELIVKPKVQIENPKLPNPRIWTLVDNKISITPTHPKLSNWNKHFEPSLSI